MSRNVGKSWAVKIPARVLATGGMEGTQGMGQRKTFTKQNGIKDGSGSTAMVKGGRNGSIKRKKGQRGTTEGRMRGRRGSGGNLRTLRRGGQERWRIEKNKRREEGEI